MAQESKKGGLKPIYLVMLIAVGGAAVVMSGDGGGIKAAAKKSGTPTKKQDKNDIFTEEDRRAKFAMMKEPLKNAFKPLIAKAATGFGSGPIGQNTLPVGLTSGEKWIYTGSAEMNGEKTALLENTATGDGVFLKVGERWKMLTIRAIRPEGLVIMGDDGTETTVPINEDSSKNATAGGSATLGGAPRNGVPQGMIAGGNAPVIPNLQGDINGGMGLQPMDNGMGGGMGGNNGRRRRNRGE